MEKLIELLNEYNGKESYRLDEDSISGEKYINRGDGDQCNVDERIISKKFGFIKWLVEQDKIFLGDIALKVYNLDLRAWKHTYTEYPIYESLLMLLSIQDNPIEFLISILK